MALTEEQKIIIGVCSGVAGLILIAILVFICCIFYNKDRKRRRRNGYKEKLVVDRYERNPYPVYEKQVPAVMYDPPPPPPPAPVWREAYYKKPRSLDVPYRYDQWDRMSEPQRKYHSESRWDGVYKRDPIVIPMAEPEVAYSGARERREPDTIYVKYVEDAVENRRPHYPRYADDYALMGRTNYMRRTNYAGHGGAGGLRRSRSFHEIRENTPYVGEWRRHPERVTQFNEYALREGKDPFLWE